MSSTLSPTSYAVLGLLAIRSWTPYEMTRQMHLSLGRFWPRVRSKLYEEPKKLAAHGLATATVEAHGKRPRTRYEITAAGRHALAEWLATPSGPPVLEAEPLVRVFLAEHGSRNALVRSLEEVNAWAAATVLDDARIARDYLAGEGGFPDRIAQLTLVGRFLSDFAFMTHQWSRWALDTVRRWPEDTAPAEPDREALAVIAARGEHITGAPKSG